jgi:hypothetical protein
MGVALGWLWCGLGGALVEPWWSLGGALVEPWGGFEVAMYSGVYAQYMALWWLWGGFGWLCAACPEVVSRSTSAVL